MSDVNIWSETSSGGAGITLPVGIAQGGTGAIDIATALTNLGIYSKVEVDALVALLISKTANTGSAILPNGTTAQRDAAPAFGYLRANSTLTVIEWYDGTNWVSVNAGGSGGGGGAVANTSVLTENAIIQTTDYTITPGNNAVSAGPVTIADGVTVVIPSGSSWSIV